MKPDATVKFNQFVDQRFEVSIKPFARENRRDADIITILTNRRTCSSCLTEKIKLNVLYSEYASL